MEEAQDPAEWVQLSCKKKTPRQSSGLLSVHPPPCYPLSGSAPHAQPSTFSSSPCPGLQGSTLLCCLLWRGAKEWGPVEANHPVTERRKPCCCFCNEGSVPASHVCLSLPVTSSARATQPALVPQASLPAVRLPGIPHGQQQSPYLSRHLGFRQPHGSPTTPCWLASVQHLLREVSQLPFLLHWPEGLAVAGWALLLGQGSGRPPWSPTPRGRAGALLQLRTLLLVVLGIAGKRLTAAEVFLLHRAAHVLLTWPRGRCALLGVLAKVDNDDVALEIHYLSA